MQHSSDSLSPRSKPNPSAISGIGMRPVSGSRPAGVDLDDAPIGAVVEIETGHSTYRLENLGDGKAMLSGHPKYCPEPVEVQIHGSLSAAGELAWHFLGIGQRMVFLPRDRAVIRTSPIKAIHSIEAGRRN